MLKILLFVFISVLTTGLCYEDYRSRNDQDDPKECSEPGLMCETCSRVVICVWVDGNFTKTSEEPCPAFQTCMVNQCTTKLNPPCDYKDLSFPCASQGLYPHPGDWTKFVFCVPSGPNLGAIKADCEKGYAFNPKTMFCDIPLKDIDQTKYPVPICENLNDMAALPQNPTLYYRCSILSGLDEKLYPFQDRCPAGGVFHNYACTN